MKLGTPLYILLLIAFVFSSIALIVGDFRTNYPEIGENVSTESYESKYNYQNAVNGSFLDISKKLEEIAQESEGWKKILGGLTVIPLAAIAVIVQIVLSIPYLLSVLIGISSDLGVPPAIVSIGIIAIIATIIIMLIKFVYKPTIT